VTQRLGLEKDICEKRPIGWEIGSYTKEGIGNRVFPQREEGGAFQKSVL